MSNHTGEGSSPVFLFPDDADFLTPIGQAINGDFLADEETVVRRLADAARMSPADAALVQATAQRLVQAVRKAPAAKSGLDAFLRQYDLSSQEGVILMCLAEALLRIPDDDDRGPTDRRQAQGRRLGQPHRRQPVAVRECVDLGADAHRPRSSGSTRATSPRRRASSRGSWDAWASLSCARRCGRPCASWDTSS